IISIIGVVGLFSTSIIAHTSAIFICVSMAILAAGGSMVAGTFGMKALSLFPQMNGTALAACTAIRLFLISAFVLLSEIYFDGTITPIAYIITGYAIFTASFYAWLLAKDSK
ncbi:MAG: hypothetical protein WBJ81_05895, partial [Rickettsiales bacterium]